MLTRKYVGDYRLENVPDAKGRLKTVAVYRCPYYSCASGKDKTVLLCIICLCLLTAIFLFIQFMRIGTELRGWYIILPSLIALLCLTGIIRGCLPLCTKKLLFRREDKERIESAKPLSLVFSVTELTAGIGGIIGSGWLFGASAFCAMFTAYLLHMILKRLQFVPAEH